MIEARPFSDLAAWSVFQALDPWDWLEAEATRGGNVTAPGLYADWRSVEGARLLSLVIVSTRNGPAVPFAVLGLSHTGQAGVAQAALLARDHKRFKRELIHAGRRIRAEMPEFCAKVGIHRIEARCWAGHPTAARLLKSIGFHHEADMPGFPPAGTGVFRQFAYLTNP